MAETPRIELSPWRAPAPAEHRRPAVIALCGRVAPAELASVFDAASDMADVWLVRVAGGATDLAPEALADALDPALAAALRPGSAVVLGVDRGAAVALRLRGSYVRRIVLAPPAAEPPDPAAVNVDGPPIAAASPFRPDAAWAALATSPRVRLYPARSPEDAPPVLARKALADLLAEACRRAGAASWIYGLDEALLAATPAAARRILHRGPGGAAFAGACLARNPAAALTIVPEDGDEALAAEAPFDAVALGGPPSAEGLARAAAALSPGGVLVARWSPGPADRAAVKAQLGAAGLVPLTAPDADAPGVLRARKAPPGAPPPPPLRVTVLALAPRLMDVRTRLPAQALAAEPDLIVDYVTPPTRPLQGLAVDSPKVLVVQRPMLGSLAVARRELAAACARGQVLVLEFDDHPSLMPKAPGEIYAQADLPLFGYAHGVQTSTEPLAALFRTVNPEVQVFPNAVFELAPFPAADRPKRVFYGAIQRGAFAVEVARALAPATMAHPDAEFVVVGDAEVFAALPTANKRFYPYLPYESYLARLAECAVCLSPLAPGPGAEAKSDAKFLDASRAGVLTIASPVVYAGVIDHGVNGLLAARLEDWAPLLSQALADPGMQRTLSRRAWDHVRAERMFADQAPRRAAWYADLWRRRAALTAQAMQRAPGLDAAIQALGASISPCA